MRHIIVLLPSKKRLIVTGDENKTLSQVLEEACKKEGYLYEKYSFRFHNRLLDLNQCFRYAGLPNNCVVEMVEVDQKPRNELCEIAVQLPDGQRKTNKFSSNTSLWDVLHRENIDCTALLVSQCSSTVEGCVVPVLRYMSKEAIGEVALRNHTLHSFGILGRVVLWLSFRNVSHEQLTKIQESIEKEHERQEKLDQRFEQKLRQLSEEEKLVDAHDREMPATMEITSNVPEQPLVTTGFVSPPAEQPTSFSAEVFAAVEKVSALSNISQYSKANRNIVFEEFKFPEETRGMDLREQNKDEGAVEVVVPCDRDWVLFDPQAVPIASTEGLDREPSRDFFEITIDDLKRVQSGIRLEAKLTQTRLAQLNAENIQRRKAALKFSVVRFQLPNHWILQANFKSLETVGALYEFVSQFFVSNVPFELFQPPNVVLTKLSQTLIDAGLSPASLVILRAKPTFEISLKESLLTSASTALVVESKCHECLLRNERFIPVLAEEVSDSSDVPMDAVPHNDTADVRPVLPKTSDLPKWLKPKK